MSPRIAPLVISGVSAGVGSLIVLLLLDDEWPNALLFALLIGLVSAGVAWLQTRKRP